MMWFQSNSLVWMLRIVLWVLYLTHFGGLLLLWLTGVRGYWCGLCHTQLMGHWWLTGGGFLLVWCKSGSLCWFKSGPLWWVVTVLVQVKPTVVGCYAEQWKSSVANTEAGKWIYGEVTGFHKNFTSNLIKPSQFAWNQRIRAGQKANTSRQK